MDVKQILSAMAQYHPSDLHLQSGCPPALRVQGVLTPTKTPALEQQQVEQMIRGIAPPEVWSRVEAGENVQFLRVDEEQGRYRVSVFRHAGKLAAVARILPAETPSLKSLALPEIYGKLAELRQGLILVGGRAGSGRSCTVAAMLAAINAHRTCKIVELTETPEFEHVSQKAMVTQIRVGTDVPTFADGFASLATHDPDVLVLGEVNDWETLSKALMACDSGMLVIGPTIAVTAPVALQQMYGSIPSVEKSIGVGRLVMNLQAICCQSLCRRKEGSGRVPATEVLRRSPAILTAIEEGQLNQLDRVISSGQDGMRTFDQDLDRLFREKLITDQEAMRQTLNPDSMQMLMRGFGARTK